MRRVLAAMAVVGLGLLGVPVAADAAPTGLQCGTDGTLSITAPGTYRLAGDLTCKITIDVPKHTTALTSINLRHHMLTGDILTGFEGPESIVDGTVAGKIGGEFNNPAPQLPMTSVKRVHVTGSVLLDDLEVRNSVIDGAVGVAGTVLVHHSTVRGGVSLNDSNDGVIVSIAHNTIGGGISEIGMFTRPDVIGVIDHNTVVGGISLFDDLKGLIVEHNLVTGSAGDGILVRLRGTDANLLPSPPELASVTLGHNTVVGNAGHGIDIQVTAPDFFIDGGGNHASGNGLDPQCVGVVCKP
jgi:hypothetical protein